MTYVDTEEIQKRMLLIVTLMIVAILIVTLKIITETELALKLACCWMVKIVFLYVCAE